jgi:hypothetical protein
MTPIAGRAGVFAAPGAEGKVVARRITRAWLVVGGRNSGQAARLALLNDLRAKAEL